MEEELADLRRRVSRLERQARGEGAVVPAAPGPGAAAEPAVRPRPDYDRVDGWRLVELGPLAAALEAAQSCGHGRLQLVEADRKLQRDGLAAVLGYVCLQCGAQTLLPTSRFSRAAPPGYLVNKEFAAALGQKAFSSLVTLVQADSSITRVELPARPGAPALLTRFTEDGPDEVVVVKEEQDDYLEEELYLEPAVCLTEEDPLPPPLQSVDPSTVTTDTPVLALATVPPGTPVMGGLVTPHPTDQMVAVHPSLFIRTTCSKILLPPGVYKYARNNGLQSIMSVKADSGSFDAIESHYRILPQGPRLPGHRGLARPPSVEPGAQKEPGERASAIQIFTAELKKFLRNAGQQAGREEFEALVTQKWAELSYEEKKVYTDRAAVEATPKKVKKPKSSSQNIPLAALKRFAATIAPGIKQRTPHLADLQNRGQLNKIILKAWMALGAGEKAKFLEGPAASPAAEEDDSEISFKVSAGSGAGKAARLNGKLAREKGKPDKEKGKLDREKGKPVKSLRKEGPRQELVPTKRVRIPKKIMDS